MLRIYPSACTQALQQSFTFRGIINVEAIAPLETLYVLPQYCAVELDFSAVQRVNSMGLAQLLKLFEYWQNQQITIYIKNANRMTVTLFKMTGLSRFLSEEKTKPKQSINTSSDTTKLAVTTYHEAKYFYDNKDYDKALPLLSKAAELGDINAQFYLGFMYAHGYGVVQDYPKAVAWFSKSAELGNARGQYNLGTMYSHGYGVEKDYNKAITWYRRAAIRGDIAAQAKMGFMYEKGLGTNQDITKAIEWYRKAASQDNDFANKRLQVLIENNQ